jgi:hypothetical protein
MAVHNPQASTANLNSSLFQHVTNREAFRSVELNGDVCYMGQTPGGEGGGLG